MNSTSHSFSKDPILHSLSIVWGQVFELDEDPVDEFHDIVRDSFIGSQPQYVATLKLL
jgi:hypothetical protein